MTIPQQNLLAALAAMPQLAGVDRNALESVLLEIVSAAAIIARARQRSPAPPKMIVFQDCHEEPFTK